MLTISEGSSVLRELDGFDDIHLDCVTNTYSRVLRHHGLDPRILGAGWGYRYVPGDPVSPWQGLSATLRQPEQLINQWYGMYEHRLNHGNAADLWSYVRSVLEDGRVVVLAVDLTALPNSAFLLDSHSPRRVVIAGARADTALVLDGHGRNRSADWLPMATLEEATGAPALGSGWWGYDARWLTVDFTAPATDRGANRFRAEIIDGVRHYFEGDGAAGIAAFREDLRAGADRIAALPDQAVLDSAGFLGHVTTMSKLYALFLDAAATELGASIGEVAETFHRAAREWNKMFHTVLFGHRIGRPLGPLLRELTNRVDYVADLEHRAMKDLHSAM